MHRYLRGVALLVGMLLIAFDARAQPISFSDRPGKAYQIRLQSESKTSKNRSSGSSRDFSSLTERVIAMRDGGLELEFDLPASTSAQQRTKGWQFPARVFKPVQGPLVLLNASEAEQRLRVWLGDQAQALCGHWFFTWTAQKIECDLQSTLALLEPYLEPTNLRGGAMYREPGAREPVPLQIQERASGGPVFVAHMEINADVVRHQRAESDVAVAEMMHRPPLSLDAALHARASEQISGTIVTTFETDLSGRVTRRARVTQIDIADQSGSTERETRTETTDWALSSGAPPR